METGKPKEGWSMNMVAFVLSTIVTFIFWSLAVGNYRSEQRALKKTLEADPEVTSQQPTLMREDRSKASIVGQVGAILLLVTALTIFIWCWKRGVFIHPGTVLFLTGYTLFSLVILCALRWSPYWHCQSFLKLPLMPSRRPQCLPLAT